MPGVEQLLQIDEPLGQAVAVLVRFLFVAGRQTDVVRIKVAQADLLSRLDSQLFHGARRCYNALQPAETGTRLYLDNRETCRG